MQAPPIADMSEAIAAPAGEQSLELTSPQPYPGLVRHHEDPFDRILIAQILIAQAIAEGLRGRDPGISALESTASPCCQPDRSGRDSVAGTVI
jgi:hypothetical protein